ncbi:MAG TPA: class III poly(R)-hydroxyalkanoic acid synthase subunit PhaE [Gammaproteobacteria bacterium]|nr:class III poly(R)-hydroxyalkanoic acid synthase subunit PhaE [Gammaproteobacteria bacterium]
MANDTSSSTENTDWFKAQTQFWENWSRMYTQGLSDTGGMSRGNWAEALDHWWSAVARNMPEHRQIYERAVEQGKTFMMLAQELMKFLTALPAGAKDGDGWKEQLKSHFDAIKDTFAKAQTAELPSYLRGFSAMFELPLDTWFRMMSGSAVMPGDVLQNVRSEALEKMGEQMHKSVDRFLSVPGVGYTRESQEQLQRFARAMLNYQKMFQEYLSAHHHLGMDTLDRLYKKLVEMGEKGESIKTLRAMYDLWVDSGEESYANFVMSSEFQDVYGKMVNALMDVKHQARIILDENLGAMNMPTRREMNSIIKHQNELRRSIKSLQRDRNGRGGPANRRSQEMGDIAGERAEESAKTVTQKKTGREKVVSTMAAIADDTKTMAAENSTSESQRPAKAGR